MESQWDHWVGGSMGTCGYCLIGGSAFQSSQALVAPLQPLCSPLHAFVTLSSPSRVYTLLQHPPCNPCHRGQSLHFIVALFTTNKSLQICAKCAKKMHTGNNQVLYDCDIIPIPLLCIVQLCWTDTHVGIIADAPAAVAGATPTADVAADVAALAKWCSAP